MSLLDRAQRMVQGAVLLGAAPVVAGVGLVSVAVPVLGMFIAPVVLFGSVMMALRGLGDIARLGAPPPWERDRGTP